MNMGEKIRHTRKSMKLTQQQLAGKEFTKGYISQIEKGTAVPSTKALKIIAERLDKSISYFLEENSTNQREFINFEKKFIFGENLFLQKKYAKSLEIFKGLLKENIEYSSNTMFIYSNLYIGKCLFYIDNYDESLDTLIKLVPSIKSIRAFEKLVDAYLFMGRCYFNSKNYKNAIINFKEGLTTIDTQELELKKQKALLLLNTATAYMNMGSITISLDYFDANLSFCKHNKITDTLLDCYVREGYIYYKLGKYKEAKKYISKALSLNNSLNYDIIKVEIYNILGMIIAKENRVEQAFDLLSKSMDISNSINYEYGYYFNVIEWINILIEKDRIDEAENMINNNFQDINKLNHKNIIYKLYGQLGYVLILKNKYTEGKKLLIEAIEGLLDENLKQDAANYCKVLAESIVNTEPDEAKKYYTLSIQCLSELTTFTV